MTYLLYIWAMIEVVLILYALYNIKKIITMYRDDIQVYYYPSDKIENTLIQVYGKYKILSFLVSEVMVFYYAVFGWFVKKKSFENVSEYTYIKDTLYGTFFWVIFISTILEVPLVHWGLSFWNTTIAWVVTGFTLYGMIWLLGDYKAIKYMPMRINETDLYIRIGLRSKVDMVLGNIGTISSSVREEEKEAYTHLVLMTTVDVNIYITLKEKVHIKGIFGSKKGVDKVALYVDEPNKFIENILERESND